MVFSRDSYDSPFNLAEELFPSEHSTRILCKYGQQLKFCWGQCDFFVLYQDFELIRVDFQLTKLHDLVFALRNSRTTENGSNPGI